MPRNSSIQTPLTDHLQLVVIMLSKHFDSPATNIANMYVHPTRYLGKGGNRTIYLVFTSSLQNGLSIIFAKLTSEVDSGNYKRGLYF